MAYLASWPTQSFFVAHRYVPDFSLEFKIGFEDEKRPEGYIFTRIKELREFDEEILDYFLSRGLQKKDSVTDVVSFYPNGKIEDEKQIKLLSGCGIGGLAFDINTDFSQSVGAKGIHFFVQEHNYRMQQFLERRNFARIGENKESHVKLI